MNAVCYDIPLTYPKLILVLQHIGIAQRYHVQWSHLFIHLSPKLQ